jgi:hypothetical protein
MHYILRSINLLILFGIKNNCHRRRRNLLLYLFMEKSEETDCSNYRGISLLPPTYNMLSSILASRLIPCVNETIGDHQCGFQHNRLIRYSVFVRYWRKVGVQWDIISVIYRF